MLKRHDKSWRVRLEEYLGALCLLLALFTTQVFGQTSTKNIFLINIDGLRWQELFTGADSLLLFTDRGGVKDSATMVDKFWRDTAHERREALMPFFWQELIDHGLAYGNRNLGSYAQVANVSLLSYPGYAEIFTGYAQEEIVENSRIQIPAITVLEFVKSELNLADNQIVAFTSWDLFPFAVSHTPGAIYCNAGFAAVQDKKLTREQRLLNRLQEVLPKQWHDVRYDGLTFYQGLEFIKQHQPRVVYFHFGETDDWAHDGRYDQVLEAAHRIDEFLMELWQWVQSNRRYRGATTFILSSDHGRGNSETEGWKRHRPFIKESEYTWIAVLGPDTPNLGELANTETVYQMNIATTLAQLLGLDFQQVAPKAADPLPQAIGPKRQR